MNAVQAREAVLLNDAKTACMCTLKFTGKNFIKQVFYKCNTVRFSFSFAIPYLLAAA
jgi:hypothetical protein